MTKCYSFYSYKGGSGRSTTAMNTVLHLIKELDASPEKPILIIDADLESAGLTFFFGLRNRISGALDGAMNTTMMLSTADEEEREAAFGGGAERLNPISQDILEEINKNMSSEDREVFEGMKISFEEKSMLLSLMRTYSTYRRPGIALNRKDAERVIKKFQPATLVKRLREVHTDTNIPAELKAVEKRKVLQNFLPLATFADVSDFYECKPGTVRFLGVDINSDKTQVVRNSAKNAVEGLLETCEKKNCAAVIFDCGAGTQSSAHVLHSQSDVVVYCMRPTTQFALGTESNLRKYKDALVNSKEAHGKTEDQKPVIILPTAVPKHSKPNVLCAESFTYLQKEISGCKEFTEIIDDSFCTPENALGEVELFKWREMILGIDYPASAVKGLGPEAIEELNKYCDRYNNEMPYDACDAYDTYAKLAKKLVENS